MVWAICESRLFSGIPFLTFFLLLGSQYITSKH